MLEFNCAFASQSKPAEGRGGDRGMAPSGTKAVSGTVMTAEWGVGGRGIALQAETFSRSPRPQPEV